MKRVFSVMIVCLLWSVPAWAQFETASVVGSSRKTRRRDGRHESDADEYKRPASPSRVSDKDGSSSS